MKRRIRTPPGAVRTLAPPNPEIAVRMALETQLSRFVADVLVGVALCRASVRRRLAAGESAMKIGTSVRFCAQGSPPNLFFGEQRTASPVK